MLSIIQVISAIVLVVLILLQERSSGLSGLMGASDSSGGGGVYQARRGAERIIFAATIGSLVVFVGLSLVQLLS
jgi:protein translocase SecG subunit